MNARIPGSIDFPVGEQSGTDLSCEIWGNFAQFLIWVALLTESEREGAASRLESFNVIDLGRPAPPPISPQAPRAVAERCNKTSSIAKQQHPLRVPYLAVCNFPANAFPFALAAATIASQQRQVDSPDKREKQAPVVRASCVHLRTPAAEMGRVQNLNEKQRRGRGARGNRTGFRRLAITRMNQPSR